MTDFYLNRTSSFDLKDGDVFHLKGSAHIYRVYLITENFVHAIETSTEKSIRLNRSVRFEADSVYLIMPDIYAKPFDGNGGEASFMLVA